MAILAVVISPLLQVGNGQAFTMKHLV